ncbi:hypothetical protein [Halomontanus rarus]|uniref:hypothetical protein n=1 Tax=Halomontanus rarus TaxID=3034020 RepID=UPI0023E82876|nr:hypothetical protein [Halovivax sp. TS33]
MALDTDPLSGPDTSGLIPLDIRFRRVSARCWLYHLLRALSLASQGDASEGASESAQMDELVEMDSHGWRVVVSEEDAE